MQRVDNGSASSIIASMRRIRLLHWKAQEAATHIESLRSLGYLVEYDEQFSPALMKSWRASPPDAFLIDLSRLPSHGREIAVALRQSPKTRFVPLVFCDGVPEKVELIRAVLPDAVFSTSANLAKSLTKAIRHPLLDPVKPAAMMDRYASRTAAQKLGIKPSSLVALIDAREDVTTLLGELPPSVEWHNGPTANAAVTLCFLHEQNLVGPVLSEVRRYAATSKLWILWRKGGSAARGDVTESLVRNQALDLGLVDYKICSVAQGAGLHAPKQGKAPTDLRGARSTPRLSGASSSENASWTAMLFALKR